MSEEFHAAVRNFGGVSQYAQWLYTELNRTKAELAKVTAEKQKYFDLLADACDKNDTLEAVLHARTADRDRLRESLQELVDLVEAARNGEYEIDSFTAQPGRAALSAPEPKPGAPKCPECNGSGEYTYLRGSSRTLVTCEECSGTGRAQ